MQKVELTVKGLSYSERQTGAYALLLAEVEGQRKLPIVIGVAEAQSIAIALEKAVKAPRPLTHDLFKNVLQLYHISLKEVIIHKMKDGIFFANLVTTQDGKEAVIDARPSDAVALAVRFKCPIFTTEDVLDKAGLILEDESSATSIAVENEADEEMVKAEDTEKLLERASIKELNDMLNSALAQENYELAASIRDEMDKRKKS